MPAWPLSLPTKCIAGSHAVNYDDNVAAFQPDVGDSIERRRYSGEWETHTFQMAMSYDQKAMLEVFRRVACVSGTVSFTGALIDGIVRTWRFVQGQPPAPQNIRGGTHYMVQLTLRRRAD